MTTHEHEVGFAQPVTCDMPPDRAADAEVGVEQRLERDRHAADETAAAGNTTRQARRGSVPAGDERAEQHAQRCLDEPGQHDDLRLSIAVCR